MIEGWGYILTEARKLDVRHFVLDPATLGPDEIIVQTECSAISAGTEVSAWKGETPLREGPVYPRKMGYCHVGRVVAAGSESGFEIGTRVVSNTDHRSATVLKKDEVLGVVPDGVSSQDAALVYLYHLGRTALSKSALGIALIGSGLLATAVRELATHHKVVEKDAATVIVTSSRWERWKEALEAAGENATILVLGFPGRCEWPHAFNPLEPAHCYDKQLTIRFCGKADDKTVRENIAWILGEMAEKRLNSGILAGDPIPAEKLVWAYGELEHRRNEKPTFVMGW